MKLLVMLGLLILVQSAATEDLVKTAAVMREKVSKGPPRRLKETVTVVVSSGSDVRLVCPVTGEPQPIVEWSKDGEVVDYTWTRINTNKNYLKLRAAQPGDTGVWNCRGVNGFGSVNVRIELIVTDAAPGEDDTSLDMAAPVFTRRTTSLQHYIKKLPGSSLLLPCEALGSPRPSLTWLHEGRTLDSDPILSIPSLTQSHSGVYTCLASNLLGSARTEFSVTVESPRVELPSISRVTNSSCGVGETAVLQCKVQSSLPASVQWLRRLEPGEVVGQVEESSSLSLAGMHLVSVAGETDSARTVSLGEGRYLDTLVIHQVEERHAGLYVCFATNTEGGFNYQTAHIEVLVDMEKESLDLLPVMAAALALVFILLGATGLLAKRRPSKSSPPSSPDVGAKVLVQPTPPLAPRTVPNFYSAPSQTTSWDNSLDRSASYVCLPGPTHVYDLPFSQAGTLTILDYSGSRPSQRLPPHSESLHRKAPPSLHNKSALSSSLGWSSDPTGSLQLCGSTSTHLSHLTCDMSNLSCSPHPSPRARLGVGLEPLSSPQLSVSTSNRLSQMSYSPRPSPRTGEQRRMGGGVVTQYHNL